MVAGLKFPFSKRRPAIMNSLRKFVAALCLLAATVPVLAAGEPLQMGVFPYLPPAKLQELFDPIAADLEKALGRKVILNSRNEYETFTQALNRQEFDIALIHPFDYPTAHDRHGYFPLARRKDELRGLILVMADSPIRSLQGLKGMTVTNPPREAAVSYLTSMALADAGIDPIKEVRRDYGKSHFSCMQKLLIGEADACGTARQALLHFEKEKQMTARFRVLHETTPVSHSLFVAHKRLASKDREALKARILDWPNTEAGRKIIDSGQFIPFVAASDKDYASVRQIMKTIDR